MKEIYKVIHLFCLMVIVIILQSSQGLNAQKMNPSKTQSETRNFFEIQQEINTYFDQHPGAKGYKQWKRKEWFLEPRLYPQGQVGNLTSKTWKTYQKFKKSQPTERSTHGDWSFIGPSSCSIGMGRVNTMAFHPTNPNIFYVGASNGGVWKTITGGSSWQNITPDIPLLAISGVALDQGNPNTIYALTGDGDPLPKEIESNTTPEVTSIGILKSTNAGGTWQTTPFTVDHPSNVRPTKLLVHPTNGQIQYVVGHHGILYTTNGWADIDTVTTITGTVYDIEFKPDDPTVMYASSARRIYKSWDSGNTWVQISDISLNVFTNASRVELAVAPSDPDIVYALGGNFNEYVAFCQSDDQGNDDTWTLKDSTFSSFGGQAPYSIGLAVNPTDPKEVFGGMVRMHKSLNEGSTWTNITVGVLGSVHVDIHDVQFANGALWVACDGGIYSTADQGITWISHSPGLEITEMYRIAGTPQNTERYFFGCQDNGTMRRWFNTTTFDFVKGGDGMVCHIDYLDEDIVYASFQKGNFFKSSTGGGIGTYFPLNVPGDESAWITPFLMDQTWSQRLFVGKDSVYRQDGSISSWKYLGMPTGNNIHTMAQGTNNANRMYVSTTSTIMRTDNALVASGPATWTIISGPLPDLFVTGIAVDPNDADNVFVSMSGYSNANKVFSSSDGGINWINLSGSLPNVPTNCIEFHNNGLENEALYLGTDIGVFYRDADLGDWIYYSNSMPSVNVTDLYINSGDNTIVASTWGRGAWRSPLYSGCLSAISLSNNTGQPVGGTLFYAVSNSISSNVDYKSDLVSNVFYQSDGHITLTQGFKAGGAGLFEGRLGPCPAGGDVPIPLTLIPPSVITDDGRQQKSINGNE